MPRVAVRPLAWQAWRLSIPGGPDGGQYHGFIGPDSLESWQFGEGGWPGGRSEIGVEQSRPSGHSLLPWEGDSAGPWVKSWGGTAFGELESHSDYVYRSPGETRPNPNASGGANVIASGQVQRTPGYAEAPGNYRALGRFGAEFTPQLAQRVVTIPPDSFLPPIQVRPTSVVAQPAPVAPGPVNTVRSFSSPPWSPAPAPTVATPANAYQPSQGQQLFSISPTTSALLPGEQVQFAASVPVTWSAIYGNITGNGLYTAPSNSSAVQDTVTATPINQAQNSPWRGHLQATNSQPLSAVVTLLPTSQPVATAAATDASLVTPASVDLTGWLSQSTVIAGLPNYAIAGAGVLALLFLMKRK